MKPIPDWTFTSEQANSYFAHDFSTAGDVNGDGFDDLIVGAMKFSGKFPDGGKAFLFLGSKRGLSATPDWTSEYPLTPEPGVDEAKEQMFGRRLTGVGDVNGDG